MRHPWFKSSYSGDEGNDMCVEIASHPHTPRIRDSKLPHSPQLAVPTGPWGQFLTGCVQHQPMRP
ncbi:DUF397 domain-containing protein [Streptomyces griseocarneus]|nr:DUF397 domain-containing protein [Streptomyces griseocarneus]